MRWSICAVCFDLHLRKRLGKVNSLVALVAFRQKIFEGPADDLCYREIPDPGVCGHVRI